MRYLVSAMLVIVGIIHLLPLSGVLGAGQLAALYGLPFGEPNLEILMRHRAVLFGLLGGFLILAGFKPVFQPVALAAGFASVISFVGLAWSIGGYNALIGRVVLADLIALACLLLALAGFLMTKSNAVTIYSGDTPSATKNRATML
ncbi:MAG: phosphopantetheine adenylyltransferase [Polaromonas sp.]|nr:phosphopantetheine adenylyltransferase [Polaromonas sp.]